MGGKDLLWLTVPRIAAQLGGEHMAESIVVGVGGEDFLLTRKQTVAGNGCWAMIFKSLSLYMYFLL